MQTALEFLEWYESVINISESEPNTLTDENISEALSMLPESEQEKLREITRYSSNLKGLEDI